MKYIFFGKKSPQYYNGLLIQADLGVHEKIADYISKHINAHGSVLDLGAGEGALSARLADMGFSVTAADKEENNFKCKNARFHKVNFDDAEEIGNFVSNYENKFDVVMGIEVIEHVQDQWQYIRQLIKMVKPGGIVLVTTPNTTSWLSRLIFLFTGHFHQFSDKDLSYGHISPISSWELELILNNSGATEVEICSAGTLPPLYITGFNKISLLGILIFPLRFIMSGILDGWCVMATARKPK